MTDEILDLLADAVVARMSARLSHETPPATPSADLPTLPESCNTATAARHLGLSAQYLKTLRVKGGGPKYQKVGRTVRYLRRDLEQFRAGHLRRNTSEATK